MGTNYLGAALDGQKVKAHRLSSADLLVGLAAVPLRILSQLWVEEYGGSAPDALWVSLSNGRDFTFRLIEGAGGLCNAYERDTYCPDHHTGLPADMFYALSNEVWARYCEGRRDVEPDLDDLAGDDGSGS